MRDNLELLDGLELSDGVFLWSGKTLRTQFPQEKHPDTELVVVTNDGQSIGYDDVPSLAEELDLELDQDWSNEQTVLFIGDVKITQENNSIKALRCCQRNL